MAGLTVKSMVKKSVKGMRISGDFFKALDNVVAFKLKKAGERAKANGRATMRPCDL